MKKQIAKGAKLPFAALWAIGTIISILLIVASAALTGALLINEMIEYNVAGVIGKVLLFVSVLLGIIVVLSNSELPAVPISAAICVSIILLQMLICAFSYEGIRGTAIVNSLIILAGAGTSVAIKLKIKPKSRRSKRAYR